LSVVRAARGIKLATDPRNLADLDAGAGALAVHVQRATVADVEQAGERGVARQRRTTRNHGDDQDQPEEGPHTV